MKKSAQAKSEKKRSYLVEQATRCLAQKGYAQVSLRDIARESGVSLGILHYYFANKEDLLVEVIRSYKERFIGRLEVEVPVSESAENLPERLIAVLRQAILQEREIHRLWYDFQVLSMYQPVFREHVQAIRGRFFQLIGLIGKQLVGNKMAEPELEALAFQLYAMIDGLFLQALLAEPDRSEEAVAHFEQALRTLVMPLLERKNGLT